MNPVLWTPSRERRDASRMAEYLRWLPAHGYPAFTEYAPLHEWSVRAPESFWKSLAEFAGVVFEAPPRAILDRRRMPSARWFEGATLNFAREMLRFWEENPDRIAIVAVDEAGARRAVKGKKLVATVASCARFLAERGVGPGDRVAGYVANTVEPIVAMLATASLGATWSSCSPDFGVRGVLDRFGQIEPKVLFAVAGYAYGGKSFDTRDKVREIQAGLPSLAGTVWIPNAAAGAPEGGVTFGDWPAVHDLPAGTYAFGHPLYVLYSSGTTGAPKGIVHGAGGVLLQHAKELELHADLRAGDRLLYFTTTGWMMWNWMLSGLRVGATIVLYDGSPAHPSLAKLWDAVRDEKITHFGTSAKFLGSCRNQDVFAAPPDLPDLRAILSTGSPLLPEDFDWVYGRLKPDVWLASISGGTDIVSCFMLGNPLLPVRRGELQCKGLGMDVAAFDAAGNETRETGELVCRTPAPSMPVAFWDDPDGAKYRKAYFETYPGVWRHGDFVRFEEGGGATIFGRSDATLNPGGVRIGTAEIYRQVEALPEIKDSLVVGQPWQGDVRVVLFVVPREDGVLDDALRAKIRERIKEGTTPRHVPAKIVTIREVPYTLSGKKVELAVTRLLAGQPVDNREALANPQALDQFTNLPELN